VEIWFGYNWFLIFCNFSAKTLASYGNKIYNLLSTVKSKRSRPLKICRLPLAVLKRSALDERETKFGCGQALCGVVTVHLDGPGCSSLIVCRYSQVGWRKKKTTIVRTFRKREIIRFRDAMDGHNCASVVALPKEGQIMTADRVVASNPSPKIEMAEIETASGKAIFASGTYNRIKEAFYSLQIPLNQKYMKNFIPFLKNKKLQEVSVQIFCSFARRFSKIQLFDFRAVSFGSQFQCAGPKGESYTFAPNVLSPTYLWKLTVILCSTPFWNGNGYPVLPCQWYGWWAGSWLWAKIKIVGKQKAMKIKLW